MTTKSVRIVGIDLGTTHTVVASSAPDGAEVFPVRQLVADREIEARALYASSLYAPLEDERAGAPDVCGDAPWVTGELAKRRGAEVPGRVIASAKSWLCHPGVDRLAPILPWGAEDESLPRLSPVDASARILAHVRRAWDEAHLDAPLHEHEVVLTVPASFDEAARELTVQAALRAGIEVRLLEEPLAAFYDFSSHTSARELEALTRDAPGGEAFVLVVDVGGGTTDLSLLAVRPAATDDAAPDIERVAVGRHLLLGGDNMDLALAHAVEPRLVGEGNHLDPARFTQLTQACRFAKERLLGDDAPDAVPIAIAGSVSRLVGSTLRAEVRRDDATRLVLDGFFPRVAKGDRPARARSALVSFGLPYERDVAITKHVAEFVARHVPEGRRVTALLLNGGVFRAAAIRARLAEVIGAWSDGSAPVVLPHTDPDLAVARGAVIYGLALHGLALRVRAGAARAYYVGVDAGGGAQKAMCVVPRGAREEDVHRTAGSGLSLVVGRPVRFDLFVSDDAPTDQTAGTIVTVNDDDFERAPPLVVRFAPSDRRSPVGDETVEVTIESKLTSVGTLELACAERGGADRRFKLAFALRDGDTDGDAFAPPSELPRSLVPSRAPSLAPQKSKRFDEAREAIDRVFGKPRSDAPAATGSAPPPRREAKDLVRELERLLGERPTWTMELTRSVFDALVPFARARRRSADHERAFWMIAGYTLRPGVGDPEDAARVALVAPLFAERLAFPDEARTWTQFFIAWRRIAAGLDEAAQTAIRDFVDPFLAPASAGLKKPKKPKLEADFEMLELAAALERVPATRRAELGSWILERTWTERDPRLWAALGRLGARVPTYGSAHHVVTITTAERWLDHLLREKWEALPTATSAAAALARRTDDRARDVSERVRAEVLRRLETAGAPDAMIESVRSVVSLSDQDRQAFLGESLPPGLRLSAG